MGNNCVWVYAWFVLSVIYSYAIKFQDEYILDSNSNMSNFAKQGVSRHNCLSPLYRLYCNNISTLIVR